MGLRTYYATEDWRAESKSGQDSLGGDIKKRWADAKVRRTRGICLKEKG